MGSPLGPLPIDVFVAKLENVTVQSTIGEVSAYCRYLDDILVLIDHNLHTEKIGD